MTLVDPAESALLIMDFQNGIVGRVPDAPALLVRTARAIESARACGMRVAYVRVAFDDADVKAMPARNKMAEAIASYGDFIRSDNEATQIHAGVAPHGDDIVVRKTRVGWFTSTDLDEQLRRRGITTLVLAGIATSGVVLSTVREAADRDYGLIVLSDACADFDQTVHDVLIEKVFPRQADVIDVNAFAERCS